MLTACGTNTPPADTTGEPTLANDTTQNNSEESNMSNLVQIKMKDGGIIKVELYPDIAPITVANFKKLVSEGFYDGLIFHRIVPGFVIQGGDPNGDGTGGSDEQIKGEFLQNGVNNTLSHERGVLSMARRSYPLDSASSQFFIVLDDAAIRSLDGGYAGFGRVTEGMDVVDAIAAVETDAKDKPIVEQVMESVTFITE
jgi:peptidyl-prolyl cis-trans isomerase B (cyclophilin B)